MIPAEELRNELTPKAFFEILTQEGKPPSVDRIQDWLQAHGYGRPNRSVISQGIKACWAELVKRVDLKGAMPDLPPETVRLVIALRDDMLRLAKSEFEEEKAQLQKTMDVRVAEVETKLHAALEQTGHLQRELSGALELAHQRQARIDVLEQEQQRNVEALELERSRNDAASAEINALRADVKRREELQEQRDAQHRQAIADERQAADVERKRLLNEVDRERTVARTLESELAASREAIGAHLERERQQSERVAELTGALAKANAETSHQARANDQLNAALEDARREKQVLNSDSQRLTAELAASKALLAESRAQLNAFGSLNVDALSELLVHAFLKGHGREGDAQVVKALASTVAAELLSPFGVVVPTRKRKARQ